jgi:hypothetical protein
MRYKFINAAGTDSGTALNEPAHKQQNSVPVSSPLSADRMGFDNTIWKPGRQLVPLRLLGGADRYAEFAHREPETLET